MPNSVDFSGRPFHFIGIGGIGMSALAYVLTERHLPVSGSDVRLSHITQRLQEAGAHIFWSQEAKNLQFFRTTLHPAPTLALETSPNVSASLPQVICSTAIDDTNLEYRAAQQLGCPIFHRSDLLAALMGQYCSIAIAGTHGKTTTSSMVGYALLQAGLDPTVVIGGEVTAWKGNARLGQSKWFVAEADESDGSLTKFAPTIGVITNIELDHTDHYKSLADVEATFQQFAQQSEVLVACWDCPNVRRTLSPTLTYSLEADCGADYWADEIVSAATGTQARIWERGTILGTLSLGVLGRHNLSNALAAIAVGRYLKQPFEILAEGLSTFGGARRRFELRGYEDGVQFIDDYAHHPSEIRATLAAASLQRRQGNSDRPVNRIVAVFQPHRYSRTATFLQEFATAFGDADAVIITDIYSAGEHNQSGISGQHLAEAIASHQQSTQYCATLDDVRAALGQQLQPGDMALFLGAGNLNRIIPEVLADRATMPTPVAQRA
ncbi:UDP-N-acetylmuramate--L-alanine ligase [Leptolyngbya sp. PCC 6406]|uniref:UDP-N-acetylmuramate--L-alanine ligase n=1 Tax=Leptolyngbya sp. PCC 6406 TaxID=1173264 RepID=UPI0002ABAB7E|nr:UDP-N-acetylmuramate--L-alanine ligase [Leptolyngbya sp. PCC 6406]